MAPLLHLPTVASRPEAPIPSAMLVFAPGGLLPASCSCAVFGSAVVSAAPRAGCVGLAATAAPSCSNSPLGSLRRSGDAGVAAMASRWGIERTSGSRAGTMHVAATLCTPLLIFTGLVSPDSTGGTSLLSCQCGRKDPMAAKTSSGRGRDKPWGSESVDSSCCVSDLHELLSGVCAALSALFACFASVPPHIPVRFSAGSFRPSSFPRRLASTGANAVVP